jgi:hypothetical protein
MVVHIYNPSIYKAEAGGLRIQGWLGVHSGFEASLGYGGETLSQKIEFS